MSNSNNNEKKTNIFKESLNDITTKKSIKTGSYVAVLTVIVIALVIFVNVIVNKFVDKKKDLTSAGWYTLSDTSKDLIKDVKDEITIYYVADPESRENARELYNMVLSYNGISDNVKVEYKNPIIYPNFIKEYKKDETDEAMSANASEDNNSIVVVNETNNKSKFIKYTDLLKTSFDQTTYQQTVTGIDIEGQIASAINFVTAEKTATIYFAEGHGEITTFGASISELIKKQNAETKTLKLAADEDIPKDCSTLLIYAPQKDLSEKEAKKVIKYIDDGKSVMIIFDSQLDNKTFKNLNSIMKHCCLEVKPGYLMEGNKDAYVGNAQCLIPDIGSANGIVSGTNNMNAFFPVASAIKESSEKDEDITIEPIVSTTEESFVYSGEVDKDTDVSKINANSEDSTKGSFMVGAAATKNIDEDKKGKLVVYSTSLAFSEEWLAQQFQISITNLANSNLLVNSVKWLSDIESETAVSIPEKTLEGTSISLTSGQVTACNTFFIFIIPIGLVIMGISISYVRRNNK